MNLLSKLLSLYNPDDLFIDRSMRKAGTNNLDFAIIRQTNARQAVWYDRDDGIRIALSQIDTPNSYNYSAVISTKGSSRISFTVTNADGSKTSASFELKEYTEEQYFQLSLIEDISVFEYEDYCKFITLYNAVTKILIEAQREQ